MNVSRIMPYSVWQTYQGLTGGRVDAPSRRRPVFVHYFCASSTR
jgi:hypothetical protein